MFTGWSDWRRSATISADAWINYISCTMDELDGLIAFLEDCKSEMGEDEEYAHFHLWFWEGWRFPKNCDVVLYFNDHLLNPAAFDFKDVLRDGN